MSLWKKPYPRYSRPIARWISRPRIRLESLESRVNPAADLAVADSPSVARVKDVAATTLQAPEMPAFATLDPSIVSAVKYAWKVPQGTQSEEWLIQLAPGESPFRLSAVGATSLRDVPFWENSYSVRFDEPKAVADFPALLASVTDAEFYYPVLALNLEKRFIPNDPLFADQWHLRNTGQSGGTPGQDANLAAAWDITNGSGQGIRGAGVLIGVIDDSLQHAHPDLSPNYSAANSFDFVSNDSDPSPSSSEDVHGTSVSGVAGGRGNNNTGVSGAAPHASLAGLRFLGPNATDTTAGLALSHNPQAIDVYNNSWGPSGDGQIATVGPQSLAAMQAGVTNGRGGLGNVYVNAGGNSLQANDDINYDGFSNSRYAITVGAIDHDGVQSVYSERGAPMLVAAYSNSTESAITTTDVMGGNGYNGLPDQNYTNQFGGTSSAAPLVTGIVALMLEANPNLSWRDVKHVLVRTADKNDPSDSDWDTNGGGFHVNHKYGFGAVDAAAAVGLAKTWAPVGLEVAASTGTINENVSIPETENGAGITSTYDATLSLEVEHVEVFFKANHAFGEDLEIVLTSPSGTQSVLAEQRFLPSEIWGTDYSGGWLFSSVRHWGESSVGTWSLHVVDRFLGDVGTFVSWELRVFGAEPAEAPTLSSIESSTLSYTAGQGELNVTQSIVAADSDSSNLSGATVSISSNYASGQDFLRFTNQNGITGSFSTGSGVLTLTGSATVAQYQTALRSIRYENTSASPSTATRTVSFLVVDPTNLNSNTQSRNMSVSAPANEAPVLSGIESSTLTYTAGQGELVITQSIAVSDSDSANLSSATVSISSNYSVGQDFLRFTNQNGITGTFTSGSGILTLTGTATVSQYQTALRSVRYENTSGSPSTATRTATFVVTDPTNLSSNSQSRNISVSVPSGNSPVLSGIESTTLSYTAGQGELAITQSLSVSDSDSSNLSGATIAIASNYSSGQDFLRFTNQNGISGNFNTNSGVLTLSGSATLAQYQTALRSVRYENTSGNPSTATRSIAFQVTDTTNANSNTVSRNIAISNGSGPGTIGFVSAELIGTEGSGTVNVAVTVRRSGGTDGDVSATYSTSNGTATSGSDYTAATGPLTWKIGEGGDRTFNVPILADSLSEGVETVFLSLTNITANAGLSEATLSINRNDLMTLSPVNRKATFLDEDGDTVTVKLGGATGTASIALTNGKGRIDSILLDGTDPMRSSLTISVKRNKFTSADNGRVALGQIDGSGLKRLNAKAVNLDGVGIHLDEILRSAKLADISEGADIVTLGNYLGLKTKLSLGIVGNGSDISINNAISSLKAASFGDGTIAATSVGTLLIQGNFLGDLVLDGSGLIPGKPVLKSLKVTGNITGSNIRVAGDVGSVKAASFRDSTLFAGYNGTVDGQGDFETFATVKSFKVTSFSEAFKNSHVIASVFKKVVLKTVDIDNDETPFGFIASASLGKITAKLNGFIYTPIFGAFKNLEDFTVQIV